LESGLADLSAAELADHYARRQCSPVEVVEAVLRRIEDTDRDVHAVVARAAERAQEEARRLEGAPRAGGGDRRPPLWGVPVTIKDLIATAGIVTTRGSRRFATSTPGVDALAVQRLRAAGAVVVAKTNTSEGGWKADTDNPVFGPTYNPWDRRCSPGGSSGGAGAAVALGMGPIGLGTDGAGSIRIPASFCGVVGLKPSFGRVPYVPPSAELLSHVGPLTRTVDDAVLALQVMEGADERDLFSWQPAAGTWADGAGRAPGRLRIAVVSQVGEPRPVGEVRGALETTARLLEDLGHHVEAVPPLPDPYDTVEIILAAAEAAADGRHLAAWRHELDPGRVAVVERGLGLSAEVLARAEEDRFAYNAECCRRLAGFDLLVTPTVAILPFPAGAGGPPEASDVVRRLAWAAFSYPFNLIGWPAVSLPMGSSRAGLPIGVQLVGRWRGDAPMLAVARQLEAARPWRPTYRRLLDTLAVPGRSPAPC
jgi:aspartyl-tRNA(Asn)/glutamyl-tRNA(Gln) amidotransferase subunit A